MAKSFPAEWMKHWQGRQRVPQAVRVPSLPVVDGGGSASTGAGAAAPPSSSSSTLLLRVELDGMVTVLLTAYQDNFRIKWVRQTILTYLSAEYETIVDRVILVSGGSDNTGHARRHDRSERSGGENAPISHRALLLRPFSLLLPRSSS